MDPIDVEPLSSATLTTLIPMAPLKRRPMQLKVLGRRKVIPWKVNIENSNPEDNPIETMVEMVGNNTKIEADRSSQRKNSPVDKQGSHNPNLDESSFRTNTRPLPSAEEEKQPMQLQWIGWVRWDSVVKISKS